MLFTCLNSALLLPAILQGSEVPPARATPQFEEQKSAFFSKTAEGSRDPIVVTTLCGSPDKNYILEVNGGGLVIEDFDGDGSHDLVVIDGSTLERAEKGEPGNPPRLMLGAGDGTFDAAGDAWAMAGGRFGMGGASGDVNGDGFSDLVITEWGADRLILNEAGKGFREVKGSGLAGKRWGTSAAMLDYNLDGNLDLVVVNYLAFYPDEIKSREDDVCHWKGQAVMCGPEGLSPVYDQLYIGSGDGQFRDVTREASFRPRDAGFGLGVMTLDYDQDGDTDIYVTNDSTPNHLWVNGADGSFQERGGELGVALDAGGKEQAGMGIACGDMDGDGYFDLFVTNFSGEPNELYGSKKQAGPSAKQAGPVAYRNRTNKMGLGGSSVTYLGWGTSMADFDLDGDDDLLVLNGHVYPQADFSGSDTKYAQEDHFYRHNQKGRLIQEQLSSSAAFVSRAGAVADLDDDGDLDLVQIEMDAAVRVFLNRGGSGHWLRLRLKDRGGNRAALGAVVTAVAGERRWVGEMRTSGGFQNGIPAEIHFGLGDVEALEYLSIRWPDGEVTRVESPALDRELLVERPSASEETQGEEQ